jgi:hypoxanthine phosphoribosyltransferase
VARETNYEAPSWSQLYSMLLSQAQEIRRRGFCPNVIVGISRGGWLPARVLSDLLENPNLANAKAKSYTGIGKAKDQAKLTQCVSTDVKGKRVLIVDEVADSGKSLKLICSHVSASGAAEIKTATLYRKRGCPFKPDFYEAETEAWVVFPWEIKETLRHILNAHKSSQKGVAREVSKLVEAGVSKRLIKRLLAELQETKPC